MLAVAYATTDYSDVTFTFRLSERPVMVSTAEVSSFFSSSTHLQYTGKSRSSLDKRVRHRWQILFDFAGVLITATPICRSLSAILDVCRFSKMLDECTSTPAILIFFPQKRQQSLCSITITLVAYRVGSKLEVTTS